MQKSLSHIGMNYLRNDKAVSEQSQILVWGICVYNKL